MKRLFAIALLGIISLTACGLPDETAVPDLTATDDNATAVVEPTATEEVINETPVVVEPTIEATPGPTASPTLEPINVWGPNLLRNPSFEGLYEHRPVRAGCFGETVTLASNFYPLAWDGSWLDWEFNAQVAPGGNCITPSVPVPNICEPGQKVGCNPETVDGAGGESNFTRTPEYGDVKRWDYAYRVRSGDRAARAFIFYGTGSANFCQSVQLDPGAYRFSAYTQGWSSRTLNGGRSDDPSGQNMETYLAVNWSGATWLPIDVTERTRLDMNNPNVYYSPNFGPNYDEYRRVEITFNVERAANVAVCVVGFWNFPFQFNEIYVDDASLERLETVYR